MLPYSQRCPWDSEKIARVAAVGVAAVGAAAAVGTVVVVIAVAVDLTVAREMASVLAAKQR